MGLGSHARRRLIPALEALPNPPIISVVSSQQLDKNFPYSHYRELSVSLQNVSPLTLFVLSNPPSCHFTCAEMILQAGFDVMVEKPGFLSVNDVNQLASIALSKKLLIVEMFMYLESSISGIVLDFITSSRHLIKSIGIEFTIPALPSNTFRTEKSFENSLLLDIGCYPLSFFAYAGFSIKDLAYHDLSGCSNNHVYYKIFGSDTDVSLVSHVGCTDQYKNSLRIDCLDNKYLEIDPFFYGVPCNRKVISQQDLLNLPSLYYEACAFSKLFSRSRTSWLLDQSFRFEIMKIMAAKYEQFACQFNH